MVQNVWDAWLQGGAVPNAKIANTPWTGYSALTGTTAPRDPKAYRPSIGGSQDTGANGQGIGPIGTQTPEAWYKDIPQTSFSDFISEDGSDWFRREWARTHGEGQKTEEALARFSPIPRYWLSALGQDPKFSLAVSKSPQKQADLTSKFYARLLGPTAGYIDPRKIMQNIVGSSYDTANPGKNDYMANLISDPTLSADSQINNFWNYVNGTVGRLMPQGTMQSYQKLIDRESNLYKDFMARNPAVSLTFNRWIGQRLGPTGGL